MKLPSKRRRRRDYRVCRLADDLGISGRTIKRCLNRHPELAVPLRATRCKGEWRFDYPKADGKYEAFLPAARAALDRITAGRLSQRDEREHELKQKCIREHFGPYTDADRAELVEAVEKAHCAKCHLKAQEQLEKFDDCRRWIEVPARRILKQEQAASRKLSKRIGADFKRFLGFGDEQRERDVARLTLALTRKRARMKMDNEGRWRDTDFDRWDTDVRDIPGTARRIASRFNCAVRDAIKHWPAHLEEKRRRDEQEIARQKESGLLRNGETVWREYHKPSGAWAYFHVKLPQTPAQIRAECERIQGMWPEPQDWPSEDWETAKREIIRAWEKRTLYEAALELIRENTTVNAENLRFLLFRDEQHEMAYKNYWFRQDEEKRLTGLDHIWLGQQYLERPAGRRLFERTNPFYGERGISLREFWQRYATQEIEAAMYAARNADASDINRGSKSGDDPSGVEPEILENMTQRDDKLGHAEDQKLQQRVDPAWASRHRTQITNNPEVERWLEGLSGEARRTAEQALSDPFFDKNETCRRALTDCL